MRCTWGVRRSRSLIAASSNISRRLSRSRFLYCEATLCVWWPDKAHNRQLLLGAFIIPVGQSVEPDTQAFLLAAQEAGVVVHVRHDVDPLALGHQAQ